VTPAVAKAIRRALVLLVCFCNVWLAARLARAEPRHTAIALVSGGANAELHARLRAELAGLGWRVKEMGLGADLALAQVARRARTLAVLRVGRSAEGIEVWVAPEVDSEARSEWIDVDARRPELAVLRAVEALRARFLELGIEPEDLRGEVPTSGAGSAPPGSATSSTSPDAGATATGKRDAGSNQEGSKKPPAASQDETPNEIEYDSELPPIAKEPELPHAPEALWLAVGGGVISASKQLEPSGIAGGAIRFVHHAWWGGDLSLWLSPSAARVSGQEGAADVRAGLLALGSELRDRRGAWTLAAGGGVALTWLSITGYPQSTAYRGQNTAVFTAMPFARAAAEYELVRRLHLRAEGTLGFTVQRAHVAFNETSVATWGRPFLGGTLGLQWAALGD
jgi:hypothetical protein